MIQLFFPEISQIPDYIDYTMGFQFNIIEAQKILNKTKSVLSTAQIMGVSSHKIYDAIYAKRMYYPDDYTNQSHSPVIQLSVNNQFIDSYETIAEAALATGIPRGNISSALRKGRHYSGGFIWYYTKDYINIS